MLRELTVLELCAGAGGQSLGLEAAGFRHVAAIDNDADACVTLQRNRPDWRVIEEDIAAIAGESFRGVDLVAGGVPCPPFSIAGKQLGESDERDLFPQALRIVSEVRPTAVMIENVRGLATSRFKDYRDKVLRELRSLGYEPYWELLNTSDYGVPQLRPRTVLVALLPRFAARFRWPERHGEPPTVGETLEDLMGAKGWPGAKAWARAACRIAPTVVGGSKSTGAPISDRRGRGSSGVGLASTVAASPICPLGSISRRTDCRGSQRGWWHVSRGFPTTGFLRVQRLLPIGK